jgi:nicotinate-nucleotide pyrophosphorylase (carboxylating)
MRDFKQFEWDAALADDCLQLVRLAIREDLDRGQDWTTLALVPAEAMGRANIVARQAGVIAGLPAVAMVIEQMDSRLRLACAVSDGASVERGTVIGTLDGPARSLLTAERPLLNFLGRLSGIATLAHRYAAELAGTKARIYDTRKTTPGWRRLEKYAVRMGGGINHRGGLYDAVLIKDNHLAFGADAGGQSRYTPADAVLRARELLRQLPESNPARDCLVEVEVDSLEQLAQVLPVGPDIVLLDNMPPDKLREAVAMREHLAPNVQLEASGNVNLQTVRAIAETGVERISSGALTHSAAWLDVAHDWVT